MSKVETFTCIEVLLDTKDDSRGVEKVFDDWAITQKIQSNWHVLQNYMLSELNEEKMII